jgi:hypothetical protein
MAPSESSGVLALGSPRTLPAISRLTLLDRLLSTALGLWGLGCLLPIAVWLGVADGDAYQRELAVRLRGIVAAALAAALLLILTRGRCTAWLHATARRVLAVPRSVFLVALGGLAVAEAIGVSVLCFARNPQLIDTWAQYVQARTFSAGTLAAVPPPSLAHFGILQMVLTPAGWFAQYPPVHPALLALGMRLGVPWLITPLLAGVLPAATYWLGRQSGDERIARLAAALVLLSPFAIAMDASAMNHLPTALCAAAGLALLPAVARGRSAAAGGFGVLVGLAAGIRPLDALALALVGAGALLLCVRARTLGPLLAAAAGGALGVLPTLLFNAATSGNALTFGYTALYGAGHGLGFHAVPWGEALTPLRAVGLTAADADQLNTYLLEWPLPVTVLVVGALLERRGLDPARRAAAAYLAALVGLLFFYFHRDLLYGPRFLFSALPAVFVLVAAAIVALGRLERPLPLLHARLGDAIAIAVVAAALPAALWLAPLRLASYSISRTVLALHPDDDARRAGLHHAVAVVRDGWGTRLIVRMWTRACR